MKICVIGGGYVGLPTAACLAENGNQVTCAEKNSEKLSLLQKGRVPIFEPGLQELFDRNIAAGRLRFTSNVKEVGDQDIYMVAVGTPPLPSGEANLEYVETTVREIVAHARKDCLIVMKSTVPVGTSTAMKSLVENLLRDGGKNIDIDLAFNPEFLKQGRAVQDTVNPDRIVLGVESSRGLSMLQRLYKPFDVGSEKVMVMDIASAEMTKYAANCMLSARISFMNELAELCEAVGADINSVRRGIGSDARIGPAFLMAGIGYGGSCFPKDVEALIQLGRQKGISLDILKAVNNRNKTQKDLFLAKVRKAAGGMVAGKLFGVWGLAFKPETDDLRDSPAIAIIKTLLSEGARIQAYDPVAMANTEALFRREAPEMVSHLRLVDNEYDALSGADGMLLMTEWKEFTTPDFAEIARRLKGKVIFDGRNQYDAAELASYGISHVPVGKKASWISSS